MLKLDLLLLESVKSLRSGNFKYYVEALKQITPWMLSKDRHNCFRCIPVQLTKIIDVEEILASLHETNFQRIVYRSKNKLKTPKKLH